MSSSEDTSQRNCVSCGIAIAGMSAARFACPVCEHTIFRCTRCRKQSNLYECPSCDFRGP